MNPLFYPALHFAYPVLQRGLTSAHPAALNSLETFTEWLSVGNIATREDVQKLETKIDNVEARLELRLSETKAEILKWLFGAIGTQTVVLLGALYGMIHYPLH